MATNLDNSGRAMLNEYLEKPLELDSGVLSTQVNLSATSLSSGGIEGLLLIRNNGRLIVRDGNTNRVLLGTQKGGF
jgi:hypothetical protein